MDNLSEENKTSQLFARGHDDNYEGLCPPEIISEDIPHRPVTATEVQREDVFQQTMRDDELFDRDLGDSSNSS